jgi:hypothetical protein
MDGTTSSIGTTSLEGLIKEIPIVLHPKWVMIYYMSQFTLLKNV